MEAQKQNKSVKIIVNILSILLIATGGYVLVDRFVLSREPEAQVSAVEAIPEPPKVEEVKERALQVDLAGVELTRTMKRFGFNMGFLSSSFISDLGFGLPIEVEEQFAEIEDESEYAKYDIPTPLEEIIPAPENPQFRNKFVWEQYEIEAPIIYAPFEDIFQQNDDQSFAFDQYVNNDPIDSPVQQKLRDGIVHLPFTPSPGEVGNSYIIGHSSNYSSVESDYNFIFEPIIEKVSEGEQFSVYDNLGRKLDFEVIEAKSVRQEDVQEAYKKFDDKRTVTLQGSILEQTADGWLPTKRYLVTGELMADIESGVNDLLPELPVEEPVQ